MTEQRANPIVEAADGRTMPYSEARLAWEAGDFSGWVEEHGFPLLVDGDKYDGWDGVEDALSDDTWD